MAETKPAPLPSAIFDVKVSTQALFDTILAERAALRQGTHAVKNRAAVRGGGKKPFAQKHTGRARAGSNRSPIWVGGGIVFGPTPERNYTLKVNRKVKRLAFHSALTLKAKSDAVIVHEFALTEPSTKGLLAALKALNLKKEFKNILIVADDEHVFKSGRNLPRVIVNKLSGLTVAMIVNADVIILAPAHVAALEAKRGAA